MLHSGKLLGFDSDADHNFVCSDHYEFLSRPETIPIRTNSSNTQKMNTDDPDLPEDKVEATFALLEAAKKLESESRYWTATEKYIQAQKFLTLLAEEKSSEAAALDANSSEMQGLQQITQLYRSKADEYWKQSRKCLIQAMEQEKKLDEQPPNLREVLDDDQARARNASFSTLFSKVMEPPKAVESKPAPQPAPVANAGDLESRLRALNSSLPSGFKTVDERMSDVQNGMAKLGMSSIYTQPKQSYTIFDDELEKSEDEQIEEIMAQAKDEVMVDKMNQESNGDGAETRAVVASMRNKIEDDDCTFADSDSGDSEGDELLDNDQLVMKIVLKKIVKSQEKISEFMAIVDKVRAKRAKEEAEEEEDVYKNNGLDVDSDDEDSFRDVQKHDAAFLQVKGKNKLKSAQRDLKKALAEWEELIL